MAKKAIKKKDEIPPWFEERFNSFEVHTGSAEYLRVNCGANEIIEIDKLYGPLCALGVRVRLEYKNQKSDWVIERERPIDKSNPYSNTEWVEMARWDCQLDWWDKEL